MDGIPLSAFSLDSIFGISDSKYLVSLSPGNMTFAVYKLKDFIIYMYWWRVSHGKISWDFITSHLGLLCTWNIKVILVTGFMFMRWMEACCRSTSTITHVTCGVFFESKANMATLHLHAHDWSILPGGMWMNTIIQNYEGHLCFHVPGITVNLWHWHGSWVWVYVVLTGLYITCL